MEFKISENTRRHAQEITGHSCSEIVSLTLDEEVKVKQGNFSPFRDSRAREIPPRGSVYLQMKLVAKLKDVSRRFFQF